MGIYHDEGSINNYATTSDQSKGVELLKETTKRFEQALLHAEAFFIKAD